MTKDRIFALVVAIIYLAILYALVRPGSTGAGLVNTIFSAFADLVRGSLGYTWDPNANKGKGGWNSPQ